VSGDLTHVLRRPVEVAAKSGHYFLKAYL